MGVCFLSKLRARSLYLYLRDNSGVANTSLSQLWQGFRGVLTGQRKWSRIEVFLSGVGECANTPQHSNLSPIDFAVLVTCTHTGIRVQDEYTTSNPRLPRSEQATCQKISFFRTTVLVMRPGTLRGRLRIPLGGFTRLLLNLSATRNVWPPVAVYCGLAGLRSWKPEKRA